jgi:hypothetical protein
MDLLSDVLRVVKPEGALFFKREFSVPWCLSSSRSNPQYGFISSNVLDISRMQLVRLCRCY